MKEKLMKQFRNHLFLVACLGFMSMGLCGMDYFAQWNAQLLSGLCMSGEEIDKLVDEHNQKHLTNDVPSCMLCDGKAKEEEFKNASDKLSEQEARLLRKALSLLSDALMKPTQHTEPSTAEHCDQQHSQSSHGTPSGSVAEE